MEQCPYPGCGKMVKNLKLHHRAAHVHLANGEAGPPDGGEVGGNKPQEAPIYSQPTKYVCQTCRGSVKEGENSCPHCGARLKWPGQGGEQETGGLECAGCGHALRRGMKRCPGCGEDIEWD